MRFPRFRKNVIPSGEKGRAIKERFKDEDICRKCGKCCYQGFVVCGFYVMVPELPCKYLVKSDNGKQICSAYEKRHELSWCHTANVSTVRKGLFPPDCVYVEGLINYHGKTVPPETHRERIRETLLKRVRYMSCPEYLKKEDWRRFLVALSRNALDDKG